MCQYNTAGDDSGGDGGGGGGAGAEGVPSDPLAEAEVEQALPPHAVVRLAEERSLSLSPHIQKV